MVKAIISEKWLHRKFLSLVHFNLHLTGFHLQFVPNKFSREIEVVKFSIVYRGPSSQYRPYHRYLSIRQSILDLLRELL